MAYLTVARAAELVRNGRVIALPTDTVYGLAASDAGVPRIYELKGRDPEKPLVLMAADAAALGPRVEVTPPARRLMERHWPGPLTLVLRAAAGGTLGVRVPDHPVALELLRLCGPLWTTSANRSGEPEAMTAAEVLERVPDVDGVIDGGRAPGGRPSTVMDMTGRSPIVLRPGPIDPDYR